MAASRRAVVLVATLVAALALAPTASLAQLPNPLEDATSSPTPSPTPTPTPTPTASSTRDDDDGGSGSRSSKTSSTKSGGSRSSQPKRSTRPSAPAVAPALPSVIADGVRLWQTREKSDARTTTELLELLHRRHGGDPAFADLRRGFGRFPVVGYVWYQDDYGAPRFRFAYRFHEGTDLFAVKGTPVIAVVDGTIWKMATTGGGGNAIWLKGDDGVRYYYGHLDGFAKGVSIGDRVRVGDHIAFVGDSGNAKGTYPHVHFEINPGGDGTVNPKPILDAWLDDAVRAARAQLDPTQPSPLEGNARWDLLVDDLAGTATSMPALWSAGFDTSGATLAYADLVLADLLPVVDWDALAAAAGPAAGATGPDPGAGALPFLFDPFAVDDFVDAHPHEH